MRLIFALISVCLLMTSALDAQSMVKRYAVELTRPANTTQYTAGDYVTNASDSLPEIFGTAYDFNAGTILSAKLSANSATTTQATFRLFLFSDSTGLGLLTDNAANPLSFSDDSLMIGYTDFTLEVTGSASGGVAFDKNADLNMTFDMNRRSGALKGIWGFLVATGTYTPTSAERFRIVLEIAATP